MRTLSFIALAIIASSVLISFKKKSFLDDNLGV